MQSFARYTGSMRNKFVIIGIALLAVALGVLVFLSDRNRNFQNTPYPSTADSNASDKAVSFTRLAYGSRSSVTARVNYLITSPGQLKELWKLIDATSTPPSVDFKTQAVIAIFAGEKPSAGYAVAVSKIEDAEKRMVSVALTDPDDSCATKRSTMAPYEILLMPATPLSLTHEDLLTPVSCSK